MGVARHEIPEFAVVAARLREGIAQLLVDLVERRLLERRGDARRLGYHAHDGLLLGASATGRAKTTSSGLGAWRSIVVLIIAVSCGAPYWLVGWRSGDGGPPAKSTEIGTSSSKVTSGVLAARRWRPVRVDRRAFGSWAARCGGYAGNLPHRAMRRLNRAREGACS